MKFLRFFWIFIALAYLPKIAFSQITIKTTLDPDGITYKVYMVSSQNFTGTNAFIGSSQITLVVPHGSGGNYFQLSNPSSPIPNMRWTFSGRTDAPPENPDSDYLFFSFINNTLPFVRFDIIANQEILLFTFRRTSQCAGRVYAFNNQTDPFRFPNSVGVNSGNSFSIFGAGSGAYSGNYTEQPLVNLSVDNNNPCAGNEVTFTATPTIVGTYFYQWYVGDMPQGSPTANPVFKYSPAKKETDFEVNVTVKLLESLSNPCDAYSVRKAMKLSVKGSPDAKIAFGGTDCMILPTIISVKNDVAAQYQWQEAGNDLINETKNILNITKSGKYTVKITKNGCKSNSDVLKVVGIGVEDKIVLDAGKDTTILAGESVKLKATSTNAIYFNWTPAAALSDATILQPIARPLETTKFTLTANNESGCPVSVSVTINVQPALYIPNAFSPNGDGLNDYWKIENIGLYTDATVEVFNRWGNTIFFSEGYSEAWDAKGLEATTYSYIIKTKFKTYRGYVTVLR